MQRNIAIIPARGGSKGIPRKNIKDFLGKPVIAYAITAARSSNLFSEVMVSTDDEEIANIATAYGANVPFFRSADNANDLATTTDVLVEVLQEYTRRGMFFSNVCCIYPCAPFVGPEHLVKALDKLESEKLDCVLPIIPFGNSIWRALGKDETGAIAMIWPENAAKRSQDLRTAYHDAGQFYFLNARNFLNTKDIWKGKIGSIEWSELEAQDIDNIVDWQLAELKFQLLKKG